MPPFPSVIFYKALYHYDRENQLISNYQVEEVASSKTLEVFNKLTSIACAQKTVTDFSRRLNRIKHRQTVTMKPDKNQWKVVVDIDQKVSVTARGLFENCVMATIGTVNTLHPSDYEIKNIPDGHLLEFTVFAQLQNVIGTYQATGSPLGMKLHLRMPHF